MRTFWDTLWILLMVAMCAACLYVLVPAYARYRRTRDAVANLQESVSRQEEEMQDLKRDIAALENDYRAIERVAREKFGLCRQSETVYHFDRVGPPSPTHQ